MKRSEINAIMRRADDFIRQQNYHLPPFAYWTATDWQQKGAEVREIVENKLGWDITDFGSGNFYQSGLVLFTVRNGHPHAWKTKKGKLYAEKIMIVEQGQVTPMHFHWDKMEDIIDRGGGKLLIQLYNADKEEGLDEKNEVTVSVDGVQQKIPPGGTVTLSPGESITLPQYCYHQFWAEEGRTLVGEVSMVNDDESDNRFYKTLPRFPEVEEDEPPLYLLCTDYPKYYAY
jgi:hypothetical protein